MTINDLLDFHKINWSNFYVTSHDCQQHPEVRFDTMPTDYLKFAKCDLRDNGTHSCINAISNAKRAIESQIDLLIMSLGFNYKLYDKNKVYSKARNFINEKYQYEEFKGLTPRIKLLNVLGLAPTLIISEIRNLRNLTEHEYVSPNYEDVKKAIEVAELFIYSSTYKFSWAPTELNIYNNIEDVPINSNSKRNTSFMSIVFDSFFQKHVCDIKAYSNGQCKTIQLEPSDESYIKTVYAIITGDCNVIPSIFEVAIEEKHLNWKEVGSERTLQ